MFYVHAAFHDKIGIALLCQVCLGFCFPAQHVSAAAGCFEQGGVNEVTSASRRD